MNNLVYFWDCSGWTCDCDSFLGYLGITLFYFRGILVRSVIVIVFWSYPLVGM